MKNLLTIVGLILVVTTIYSQKTPNCYTLENFNALKIYIEKNEVITGMGKIPGHYSNTITKEFGMVKGDKSFTLKTFEGRETITVNKINNEGKNTAHISIYTISNQNGKITDDAYASRFDTEQDVLDRAKDWCEVIKELNKTN